jgi:hypothetical protein
MAQKFAGTHGAQRYAQYRRSSPLRKGEDQQNRIYDFMQDLRGQLLQVCHRM